MSDNMVYSQMKEKAENADPIGGTLKFIVDKSIVPVSYTHLTLPTTPYV